MGNESFAYKHVELTREIIGAFFEVYNELGPGLRERVYERALALALRLRGVEAVRQLSVPLRFRGKNIGVFRPDLIVAGKVVVELKALPNLESHHIVQAVNALRATKLEVGLLLNFGPRAEIKRVVATGNAAPEGRSQL